MQLVLVQFPITWEAPQANFHRVRHLLSARRPEAGALVILPEMFASGFSMNVERIAEQHDGPVVRFMRGLARRYDVTVVGGRVTRTVDGRGRNEAIVVGPEGDLLATYVKMHPFSPFDEHLYFTPGTGPVMFEWGTLSVAPFVCYDLRFPEIYRSAAMLGAELLVTIANWPEARIGHWIRLLEARAIENLAFSVGVNRTGADPNVAYPGKSRVVDPFGGVRLDAGREPGVYTLDIDPDEVRKAREQFPALRDTREDFRAWAGRGPRPE